jgi:chromate reductase, NAD(P)H dehydrogenase (quinone)
MPINILAFSGSTRANSVNQKLLDIACAAATAAGARVVSLRLADYPMPFYDAELEQSGGLPRATRKFQQLLAQSDALLIASPEYNGGYTAVMKNTLDWSSRPDASGRPGIQLFSNKPVAILSASPGPLGGVRGQTGLRMVLEKLGALAIPQSFALGLSHDAFDSENQLKDKNFEAQVRAVGEALVDVSAKLRRPTIESTATNTSSLAGA